MNEKIFVDTSAWLASTSPKETRHLAVSGILKKLIRSQAQIFTSNNVVDETVTRFNTQSGWHLSNQFINHIQKSEKYGALIQLWTDKRTQIAAFQLLGKFKDHRLSLTDTTSAILMKNFGIQTILTLDFKHFTALGFQVLPTV